MPALVAGKRNSISIFLYSTIYNLLYAAIMAQMYYFGTCRLNDTAHNINGSIVSIEQGRCSHNANMVLRLIFPGFLHLLNRIFQTRIYKKKAWVEGGLGSAFYKDST